MRLEVVWGGIAQATGDVYACGHYENVLPAAAEVVPQQARAVKDWCGREGLRLTPKSRIGNGA